VGGTTVVTGGTTTGATAGVIAGVTTGTTGATIGATTGGTTGAITVVCEKLLFTIKKPHIITKIKYVSAIQILIFITLLSPLIILNYLIVCI
jgi:hypothetical protein